MFMKLHNYIFLIGFISFGQESNLKINSFESRADRVISKMTLEERIENINKGGSMMPAFSEVLSEEQIQSVATYLDELKNQD